MAETTKKSPLNNEPEFDTAEPIKDASTNDESLMDIDDTARYLKTGKHWIYDRTRQGLIPHIKLGKYLRFSKSAIDAWLADQYRGPAR